MSRRVLVTGASGFVGRAALLALACRGDVEVHGTSRAPAPTWLPADVHWHAADLLASDGPARLVQEAAPEAVLHLAWEATPGRFWAAPDNLDWAAATLRLARALGAGSDCQRIVGTGTCAEYDWADGWCVEGSTPLRPGTLYGTAKDATRRLLEAYAAHSGLSVAWGRIFYLYGPHEHPDRLVPSIARRLLAGERAPTTPGHQRRDFLHVDDVAGALTALLLAEDVTGPVNIASGEPVAVGDIVRILADEAGRPELVGWGDVDLKPSEPPLVAADVTRLRQEVGFTPRWTLADGLQATVRWWGATLAPPGHTT